MWSGAETGFQCEAGGPWKVMKMASPGYIHPNFPSSVTPGAPKPVSSADLPQDEEVHGGIAGHGDIGSDHISLLDRPGGQPDGHAAVQTQLAELGAVLKRGRGPRRDSLQVGRALLQSILAGVMALLLRTSPPEQSFPRSSPGCTA